MALVSAEKEDSDRQADALLSKLLAYRMFADEAGKMSRSVTEIGGGLPIRHAVFLHAGCAPRSRMAVVRFFCDAGASHACNCRHRTLWRRHAGDADHCWLCDFLAAGHVGCLFLLLSLLS